MGRRIKIVCACLFAILLVAFVIVFWPRSTAPLPLLEGMQVYGEPHDLKGGWGSPPSRQWAYTLKGDWDRFVKKAQSELLKEGWKEEADIGLNFSGTPIVCFRKTGRFLALYKDSTPETNYGYGDLVMVGTHQKGTIGACYDEDNYQPPFLERTRRWILAAFGQRPKEENE